MSVLHYAIQGTLLLSYFLSVIHGVQSDQVFLEVQDDNDNDPVFELPIYSTTRQEDMPIGASVLEVKAVDIDSGTNAELVYTVDHEQFRVDTVSRVSPTGDLGYVGIIRVNKSMDFATIHGFSCGSDGFRKLVSRRLDYDRLQKHEYRFTVTATDKGTPSATGTANITVFMTNVNDEPPEITVGEEGLTVREDAQVGSPVAVIQAIDLDKDQVSLYFSSQNTRYEIFEIIPSSGLIRLAQSVPADRDQYVLNITAVDGGSCCGGTVQLSSEVTITAVRIKITDMNDNSPYFERSYNASVREDASVQESVLTVNASDPDDAAVLSYYITSGNVRGAFGIQARTGMIFVGRQLDYETEQHIYNLEITVSDGVYTNTTTATIHVLDTNDNSPVFDEDSYIITSVVEGDNSIIATNKTLLVTVSATDADIDRPTNISFSLLGFGTSPPNKYFEIEADTGRLYLLTSLDRDLPSGRPNYQFNIRAQDEPDPPPGSDLDQPQFGYTSVQVKPIDINDNAPIFISKLEGSVPEHSARGSPVMTVVAIDYDEGQNGIVEYEVAEGPSQNGEMKFTIDDAGLITTDADEHSLDREVTPAYHIIVRASDRGNDPQSTYAEVMINLVDINDQIPVFERQIYKVNMSEAQASEAVARVKATDDDIGENAWMDYSLNNHLEYFYVENVKNEGSIAVFRAIDYEDVNQRFFNLTVVVRDRDPTHKATAHVEVTVEDINDNAPWFVVPRIEAQKLESEPVGTFLAHFSANDADSGINAVFAYLIDQKTDPDRLFSIDDTGNVTIKKMMDREKQDRYEIYILATDKGDPPQTGTATLIVTVLDVNDNFPIFADDYRPLIMENADIVPELITVVNAIERDLLPFGAPFGFAETPCSDGSNTCPCTGRSTCNEFSFESDPSGDDNRGLARISTKRVFDREQQKFYHMPIVMWDMRGTGDPRAMTGTNTLTIEIGDINDNIHSPGHKDILVYNYKGMFGPVEIGTVYATDPDDWDVVDKIFTHTGQPHTQSYFSVDKDTGMITMTKGVPGNKAYSFTVDVYDRVWKETAECTVTVTVRDISEKAVFSSGAVRLKGITAEEFVRRPKIDNNDTTAYAPSKYDKFRTFIAGGVGVPTENVDIFSVQNKGEFTDVRFSAHDSYNYSTSKMNSVVVLNKDSMEREVGIQVALVPIDECTDGTFDNGCFNLLRVTENSALVNTNGTSFVGVEMFLQAMEGCRSDSYPPADECSADYCYNGGTCTKDDWGDVACNCLTGFEGPRCQGTHHSFDGNSYALYDPLEQCENSRTSLYIITSEENGLIFYNGPTSDREPNSEEPTDFISLELSAGYPRLRIDHGSGVLELYLDGRDQQGIAKMRKLNDGNWRRIDIIRQGREVEMIVDHCDTADIGLDGTVRDDNMCRLSGFTPGDDKFLNVRTLLQVGGRFSRPSFPRWIMPYKYDGCIKNLIHNGRLYDLTVPGNTSYPSGENRCTREDAICGVDTQTGPACGVNGICESTWLPDTATCICKPGYMGDKCGEDATTKDLRKDSFMQWRLLDSFFNTIPLRTLKMQVMFRTRAPVGVLWTVSSINTYFIELKIVDTRLTLNYNLGDGIRHLELSKRFVSNGGWHVAVVERFGREFLLKMDNGEGPNFNYTFGYPTDKYEVMFGNNLIVGAGVSFADTLAVLEWDLQDTCLRDIRMNNEWFPMDFSETDKSDASEIIRIQNVRNGCVRNDCSANSCPSYLVCYPLWESFGCRCQEHYEKQNGVCFPIDYCASSHCFANATCQVVLDEQKKYKCDCPPGWEGELCDTISPTTTSTTTSSTVSTTSSLNTSTTISSTTITRATATTVGTISKGDNAAVSLCLLFISLCSSSWLQSLK